MLRWEGRVALVTGASSGMGAAIAQELVKKGMKVVGCAPTTPTVETIQAMADKLKDQPGKLYARKCDVRKEIEILDMFSWIKKNLQGVDVCVNNAGIMPMDDSLMDGKTETWRNVLDVNVLALCICTRESLRSMKERNVDDGQIINICSVSGHYVQPLITAHFYIGTKHAVKAFTEGLRQELAVAGSNNRITAISPGMTRTGLLDQLQEAGIKMGDVEFSKAKTIMESKDIADAVVYVLSTPPTVQVHDIIIRPTRDPSVN